MNFSKCIYFLNFVVSSFNHLNIRWCCDISQFRNNVLCAIVIWWKILTFTWLWPIIEAETCCTLYNKYFPITDLTDVFSNPVIYFPIIVLTEAFSNPVINFADHNSLSLPQITNSLVSYVLSLQVQTSLLIDCVQSHSSWFLSVSTDTFRNSKSNKFTAEPFWSFPFTIH